MTTDTTPHFIERHPDWPVELCAAADNYETAMVQVDEVIGRKLDERRREMAIAALKRLTYARDRFVMLRKRYRQELTRSSVEATRELARQ